MFRVLPRLNSDARLASRRLHASLTGSSVKFNASRRLSSGVPRQQQSNSTKESHLEIHADVVSVQSQSKNPSDRDPPLLNFNFTHNQISNRAFGSTPSSTARDGGEILATVQEKETLAGSVDRNLYWQKIPIWKNVSELDFLKHSWQVANSIQGESKLFQFLNLVVPALLPPPSDPNARTTHIKTRDEFIQDVKEGMVLAPMSIRLTPHTLSVVDWSNPIEDPIRRQFIPMKSSSLPDHPRLTLDSLGEQHDSKVPGLVHRYPDKALFLAVTVCPTYCRFCTRSYAIGEDTETVEKAKNLKPSRKRWDLVFEYIKKTPALQDIVVSGGDCYYLQPHQLYEIGERLVKIPHIRRFRFATKGLAVSPSRILDTTGDSWTAALIAVSNLAKKSGKAVAVHTHFNHPNEITWVTKAAAQKLFEAGVTVRNQSVLLRGVNDDVKTMKALIRGLGDINIIPYYVYQGDMVKGVEDLRTPLQTILDLECQIRGSIAGFLIPNFVVDLPGGGGKRLAASNISYDRFSGISKFVAPAVTGGKDKVFEYHDPVWSLPS